ncbi:MAG TPA: ester cyclase [Candidatus Dormibacteraeota bacterium]|nr:ester cyclase [Candidatus Dormibacteraeota bacterium]
MSEENKALVRRATDAGNDEGTAAIDRFYGADWIGWDSRDGSKSNREDMKKEFEVVLSGFPDARVDIEDLIAEGDKVATRLTLSGTHTKDSAAYGAPTGKRISLAMMGIDRIANGKIVESWSESSGLGFHYQLTGKPAPSLKQPASR